MEQLSAKQHEYAKLINISGKQRMMSQRIVLAAITADGRSTENNQALNKTLLIEQLLADHEVILKTIPSAEMRKFYYSPPYNLDRAVRDYAANMQAQQLTTADNSALVNDASLLLEKLDAAVHAYQIESEAITRKMLERELLVLIGAIVTLSLEYLFLFLPIFRRLKENESNLLNSHEVFQNLVRLSPDGTQVISLDGHLRLYSDLSKERLGYNDHEMDGLHISDWDCGLPYGDIEQIIGALSKDKVLLFETKHKCKNGEIYDALISARLVELNDETLIYASVRDVTALNEMKRRSDIDALKLRVAASSAKMGIWQWNISSDELIWDAQMCQIFEVDKPLSVAEWRLCIDEKDREAVNHKLQQALQNHGAFQATYSIYLPNGRQKRVLASATPLLDKDANTSPLMLVGSLIDVTQEYKNTQQLSSLNLQLSQAQTMAKLGHWDYNHTSQELFWSDEIYSIFSLTKGETTPSVELYLSSIHPDDRAAFKTAFEQSMQNKKPYDIVQRLVLAQSERLKYVREIGQTFFDEHGKPTRSMGTVQDITAQRLNEINSEQYIQLIDKHIITSKTDLNGTITEVSGAFCQITGYSKDQLIGCKHNLLRHPDTPDAYYQSLWHALLNNEHWQGEIRNRNRRGEDYWLTSSYSPILDELGKKVGYSEISQDITARKLAEELAIKDQLTGLYNRFHIDQIMRTEVERSLRYGNSLSLILVDLDHFKAINDTYGHLQGDQVLQQVARILSNNTRTADCVGRWGGEEFIVVSPHIDAAAAYLLADKLRAAIYDLKIPEIGQVSASFGVSQFHTSDANFKPMIARADQALYQAKAQGRNQVVIS